VARYLSRHERVPCLKVWTFAPSLKVASLVTGPSSPYRSICPPLLLEKALGLETDLGSTWTHACRQLDITHADTHYSLVMITYVHRAQRLYIYSTQLYILLLCRA